jgi:hypothetical protein
MEKHGRRNARKFLDRERGMNRAGGGIMDYKPDSEEGFIAGFRYGYANGQASKLTQSQLERNAEAAYEKWHQEQQKAKT